MCNKVHVVCCVCTKKANHFCHLWDVGSDLTKWISKLSGCVPEVEWKEEYLICELCCDQLEQVCTFRKLCLEADALRKRFEQDTSCEENSFYEINGCDSASDGETTKLKKNERFTCFDCGENYESKKHLVKHIRSIHPSPKSKLDDKFECELCHTTLKGSQNLTSHITTAHGKNVETFKPFCCKTCKCRFATSSGLTQHSQRHSEERNHICSFCGKGFKTKGELKVHELIHLNKRSYFCETCQKGFNTHKNLGTHNLIKHRDPNTWNYVCSVCDRRFPIKSNYDSHVRRHFGKKPFSCHFCDKSFVTKDELGKHRTSHSNVRPHKCEHCGKEYKERRIMEVHLKKAHGLGEAKLRVRSKNHICGVCGKGFCDRNKLTRHMCTHTGEKPFACHLCDKKFTDRSYVKQHLKNNHGVYDEDKEGGCV